MDGSDHKPIKKFSESYAKTKDEGVVSRKKRRKKKGPKGNPWWPWF